MNQALSDIVNMNTDKAPIANEVKINKIDSEVPASGYLMKKKDLILWLEILLMSEYRI